MENRTHYLEQDFREAIQKDSNLLQVLGDRALDGLWFWDLENPEEEWFSDGFWALLGYNPKEMPTKFAALQDLISPDHFEKAKELIEAHLANPEFPYEQTLAYKHKDGHYVWLRCVGQSLWRDQKPIRMLGAHVDISKEVKLHQDFASFFNFNQNLILIANDQGKILRVNSGSGQPLGSEETLRELNLNTLLESHGLNEVLRRALETNTPQHFVLHNTKDQGVIHLSCQLWYAQGHYYLSGNDATNEYEQRKIAQKQTELKDLLLGLASNFIEAPLKEVPNLINATLAEIGQFVQADRSYIFDYDFEAETTTNTYEWCRSGISPQIENLKDVPMEYFPQWLDCHLKGESMYIPDVTTHHDQELGQFLAEQEITSLLAVPIYGNNKCLGFIGFDWVVSEKDYNSADEDVLRVFASMLGQLELRTQTQEKVEASQILNSRIIDRINKPLLVLNKDSSVYLVNEAFCSLVGSSREELIQEKAPYSFWPQERLADYAKLIQDALDENCQTAEIDLQNQTGELVPAQTFNELIRNPKGDLNYLLVSFEDLREKRKLQESLRVEREFAELLLNNSPIFIFGISHNGTITELNQELASKLPGSKDTWIGQPAENLCIPSQAKYFNNQISSLEETSPQKIVLHHQLSQDNKESIVEWRLSKPDATKAGTKWILFGVDITKERLQERKLKESQENLQKAQEIARMGSWEINLQTGTHFWSEELYNLLQLPKTIKPSSENFLEFVISEDQSAVTELLNLALDGEMEYKTVYRFRKNKTNLVYLEDIGQVYRDTKGIPEKFVGTIQDVTFREKSKEKLNSYQSDIERKNLLSNLLVKINSQLLEGNNWKQVLKLSVKYLTQGLGCNISYGYHLSQINEGSSSNYTAHFITRWLAKGYAYKTTTPKRLTNIQDPKWKKLLNRLDRERVLFTNHNAKIRTDQLENHFPWQYSENNVLIAVHWGRSLIGMIILPEVPHHELDSSLLSNLKILSQNLSASYNYHHSYNELKKSNQRFRILNHINNDATFEVDIPSQELTVSEGFNKLLNIHKLRYFDGINRRIHPTDLPNILKVRKQLQEGEIEKSDTFYRILTSSNEYSYVRERCGLIRDADSKPKAIIGTISRESEIGPENNLFKMASHKAKLGPVEIDLETNQIRHTKELYHILDLPPSSKLSLDNNIFFWHKESWIPMKKFIHSEFHKGNEIKGTFKVITGNKVTKWIDILLLRTSEEKFPNINGYLQDISKEVTLREKYRKSNFWLEKSQETASLGNFIANPDTGIYFISDQGKELVKAPKDFPLNQWIKFINQRYQPLLRRGIRRLIQNDESIDIEVVLNIGMDPDQAQWFHITAELVLDENDRKIMGTFQNIHQKKVFEEELKLRNNSLRKMAWQQSHLIRSPLSRMMGIIDAMASNADLQSNTSLAEHFKALQSSTEELDSKVHTVIETANNNSGIPTSPSLTSPDYLIPAGDKVQLALVDDDPIIQSLHRNIVLKEDLCREPLEFSNGKLLIDHILHQDSPDNHYFIFLDLNMPVMDGWQTLESLHSIFFESNIYSKCLVVILTSSPDPEDLYRAYTFPLVVDYLKKPLQKDKIEQIKKLRPLQNHFST